MIAIDTNIYSALDSGRVDAIEALQGNESIGLPINVLAELSYGFKNGSKYEENKANIERFLAQQNIELLLPTYDTADFYATLVLEAKRIGRVLSQNDIWIAALCLERNVSFMTYDKDFEAFRDFFGDKLIVLDTKC